MTSTSRQAPDPEMSWTVQLIAPSPCAPTILADPEPKRRNSSRRSIIKMLRSGSCRRMVARLHYQSLKGASMCWYIAESKRFRRRAPVGIRGNTELSSSRKISIGSPSAPASKDDNQLFNHAGYKVMRASADDPGLRIDQLRVDT